MSRPFKTVCAGLSIGIIGLVVSLTPFGIEQEENIGLHLLFKLRGTRKAPPDVIVVATESVSENQLSLPSRLTKWPRSLHARLINHIANNNAAVIALDIFFSEVRSTQDDYQLARAIQRAGNVVLVEDLKKDLRFNPSGTKIQNVEIEKIVPPIPLLAQSALASAPFPLPKIPVKLTSYWTFKTSAGDTPTLPVVVFQIFALQVYDEFMGLLKEVKSSSPELLPFNRDMISAGKSIKGLMLRLKNFFEQNPLAAAEMLAKPKASSLFVNETKKRQMLESLIRLYQGPNSQYLNFYGPPGTINTVPYYHLLEDEKKTKTDAERLDLKDKVIFIGRSERLRPDKEDDFHTVFSQSSGVDISGVEIAATALANLLENMPVQPLNIYVQLVGFFVWGAVLGILCFLLPRSLAAGSVLVLSLLYLLFAYSQFNQSGIWYPLVIPLFLQSPLSFIGTTIWKYVEVNKERQNIRTAFEYHIPNNVVDELAKSLSNIKTSRKSVYGICLFTDAKGYTSVSETMDPEALSSYMNKYFEVIFEPVRKNSGIGLELKADSMLAIWTKDYPDSTLKNLACHAALDIIRSVDKFNRFYNRSPLPTRIGIHSGYISLKFIGAIDHYQYQPVGDAVNTASRMEGLNKHLGTQILVSEEVLEQLDDFLVRKLGQFILAGKSKPVAACELICRMEESTELQKNLCKIFAQALDAFQRQSWNAAIAGFNESVKMHPEDGPSRFYLNRCEKYKRTPPDATWDSVVRLAAK
ncbi:MAG: adenylate/guanylate cyclase domain-containing protein [Desulfobacterales bacterium]|nr:adenylate/guanylate cyclase domain-containing protein [Desulfobacterales bacterium]